ncbi:hypothetical protein LOD99_14380 [Oopsacas minuta]|uniref:Uncharacterized protein n=1 Tax=Oopsacas minuta TaxID=111878 RepID=A0AAV7KHH6_9METZ|nr:hypothetical protein LOD99_14380 [Oopsacas minuta]
MRRDQRKLTRSAEILGSKTDSSGKILEYDRFHKSGKEKENTVGRNKHLFEISSWELIPKSGFCISQLLSEQQQLEKQIEDTINSQKSIDSLRNVLKREEQELKDIEDNHRVHKIKYDHEATKLSSKYLFYKCILPLQSSLISLDPLTIQTTIKKDSSTPIDSYTLSEADLNSSETTNKIWDY